MRFIIMHLIAGLSFADCRRVIAIGDLHGDVGAFQSTLRVASLIGPTSCSWTGGTTTLVQLGDVLDRGTQEQECWDLLQALKREASAVGGEVITLLGNHEILNLRGEAARFIHPKAHEHFGPDRAAAFAPGGTLAREFAECPVVAIIDDTAYVHAALPHGATRESCADLNAATRAWLLGEVPQCPPMLLPDHGSPVWNRAYSSPSDVEPSSRNCRELKRDLGILGVSRVVVGHTPQDNINAACDGAVWRCDTGMSAFVMDGVNEALEIVDGCVRILRAETSFAPPPRDFF